MTNSEAGSANPPDDKKSGSKNCRATSWWQLFNKLHPSVKELCDECFEIFKKRPDYPSFENHQLKDTRRGRHRQGSRAIYLNMQYRAIYVIDEDTNVWYWVGNHNDYENFIGRK